MATYTFSDSQDRLDPRSSRHHRPAGVHRVAAVLLATLAPLASVHAQTDATDAAETDDAVVALGPATADDGPTYAVGVVTLRYLRDNPQHPPLEAARQAPVTLGQTTTGYVAPREGVPSVTLTIDEIASRPTEVYHASAIQHLLLTLRDHFVAQDLLGVYVAPDPQEITATGNDLRVSGDTDLAIIVTTGIVTELRTVGSGERVGAWGQFPAEERINNPVHQRIIDKSPIRPYTPGDPAQADLLKKGELDRYLFHLGRHPGRRVDAAVAAAEDVGGVSLDYLVTENRPLVLYAQVSNTGTRNSSRVRERFGLFHTQLTNADDILSIDYYTANFDEIHSATLSYERPFPNDRIRWKALGRYYEYTASEVGAFLDTFRGKSWTIGGDIYANIYQNRELFLDFGGGARYDSVRVENRVFDTDGRQDFFIPFVGFRFDQTTQWFSTQAWLSLEWQAGNLTDIDDDELTELGRTDPASDWAILRWDFNHSVFLEALLDRKAWEDPSTPQSSTLAHELRVGFHGQYAFDKRLIPQYQQTLGGLHTIRGYEQSIVAGDSAVWGTLEYRFHLPRAFRIQPTPRELFGEPFRAGPQFVYGSPDWDFILKGFVDAGQSIVSDDFFFESDETLVGAGIGFEFLYKRNLNIRVDWGFVLNEIPDRSQNKGANRLIFVATVLF